MSEEYFHYVSSLQYLGMTGITQPCVLAMAAILTSAFRPEKITAVIWEDNNQEQVLFLVWNWLYSEITIIPDGFGTHGGEGGRGLSTVLGLSKFYEIPLLQVWINEKKEFMELAEGNLSEETFSEIQETQVAYNWNFHPASEVRKVKKGKQQFLEIRGERGSIDLSIRLP